jgi:signal transduction histidine kinase
MQISHDIRTARSHTEQVPPWLLDTLLGIAVALVIALVISAKQGGRHEPDAVAYLFAAGFGALMLVRRRLPLLVLVLTMLLLFVYYPLGYPAIGLAVPVFAALYSAAEQGRWPAAIGVSVILVGVSTYFRLQDGESLAYLLGYELVSTLALLASAIALGDSARSRRALRAEQARSARLIAQEHAARAEQRVQAERVAIARDLHDLLGHSIAVIALQASVAQEVIGSNDAEARQALTHIRTVSAQTMQELRGTVKLLRAGKAGAPDRAPVALSNLAALIDNARATGLLVHVEAQGALGAVPALVSLAAYRIVQEALTNVIRHARAHEVWLHVAVAGDELQLCVRDDGRAARVGVPGNGIAGMKERARVLGGTFSAGLLPSGGFAVEATLPLAERG